MMKKKQSIIALVLAAIVTVLLGWTMIKRMRSYRNRFDEKEHQPGSGSVRRVSITYQAVKDNPIDEEMSDTRYKLEQRAQQLHRRGTGISAGRQPYHH